MTDMADKAVMANMHCALCTSIQCMYNTPSCFTCLDHQDIKDIAHDDYWEFYEVSIVDGKGQGGSCPLNCYDC